jgi:hypothetical protein
MLQELVKGIIESNTQSEFIHLVTHKARHVLHIFM